LHDDNGDDCILDTGANHSTLIRSEAKRLNLKVLPAGIELGTGAKLTADAAVAPLLKIGNLEYHHVAFLVVPDAAFTLKNFIDAWDSRRSNLLRHGRRHHATGAHDRRAGDRTRVRTLTTLPLMGVVCSPRLK